MGRGLGATISCFLLQEQVWGGNLGCLYQGATAAAAATAVGYFPWFLTFNYLNGLLAKPSAMGRMLLRNAGIGLASSISSDVCSNSIRVLKTTKQAAAAYDAKVTYRRAAALVIEKDGLLVSSLFSSDGDVIDSPRFSNVLPCSLLLCENVPLAPRPASLHVNPTVLRPSFVGMRDSLWPDGCSCDRLKFFKLLVYSYHIFITLLCK